uniref:2',5'-phosphodiesterase 12-like N-terminal domain-containing protein n=1 Tax=Ciona savignyi TaxID=51511 RepID=H2YAW1_CIOSA
MTVRLFRVAKFCKVLQPNLRHVACSSKWGSVQRIFSLLGAKERPSEFAGKMKVVRVSQPPDSDHVTLSLELGGKLKQLHRPNEETLEKTFCRLRATLQNAEKSNKKRKHEETGNSQTENSQINMSLLDKGGEQCPLAERCDEVWKDAAMLEIHDEKYRVVYNPPTVAMIKLPQFPLAGMTLHPVLQFEFATHQFSKFAWYKSKENECNGNGKKKSNSTTQWEFISNNKLHAPSFSDVGFKFKLKVTPGSEIHPAPVNDLTSN